MIFIYIFLLLQFLSIGAMPHKHLSFQAYYRPNSPGAVLEQCENRKCPTRDYPGGSGEALEKLMTDNAHKKANHLCTGLLFAVKKISIPATLYTIDWETQRRIYTTLFKYLTINCCPYGEQYYTTCYTNFFKLLYQNRCVLVKEITDAPVRAEINTNFLMQEIEKNLGQPKVAARLLKLALEAVDYQSQINKYLDKQEKDFITENTMQE